jgi:hypothetical protein
MKANILTRTSLLVRTRKPLPLCREITYVVL